jgi:hypothetical protein
MQVSSILRRCSLAVLLAAACTPADADDSGREPTTGVLPPADGTTTTATDSGTTAVATSTASSGSTSSSTTAPVDDTFDDGPSFDVGMGNTTGEPCVPVAADERTCDGLDDDCNGFIDDIDAGGDGICDCLAIALIGTPGGLAASQFEQWLIDRGTSAERIDPPLVDAAVLAAYDVVILDQLTRAYTPAEAIAFDTWVNAGGGLMAMTGHTASPVSAQQWPNTILEPMGLVYQGPLLNGPVTDFLPHPITMGLTSVTFLGGFEVAATIPGQSEVVARLPGMIPAAQAQERGAGKVFVWGDEWIEYDSEWSALPEITVLWTNIFEWLTPATVCSLPEG